MEPVNGMDESMVKCTCEYGKPRNQKEFRKRMIKGYEADGEKGWVHVPHKPATFGHLIVVSGKCYTDISDPRCIKDTKYLQEVMTLISRFASKMKKDLKDLNGRKCEKVYVVTECETEGHHLHFHLIPRFEGDIKGHTFLFEKELEEARWMLDNDDEDSKTRQGFRTIGSAGGILDYHRNLLVSNKWARNNGDRKRFIKKTKREIERILTKA